MERKCNICGRPLNQNGICPVCSRNNANHNQSAQGRYQNVPVNKNARQYRPYQGHPQQPQHNNFQQPNYPRQQNRYLQTPPPVRPQTPQQNQKKSLNAVLIACCCCVGVLVTFLFVMLGATLFNNNSAVVADETTTSPDDSIIVENETYTLPDDNNDNNHNIVPKTTVKPDKKTTVKPRNKTTVPQQKKPTTTKKADSKKSDEEIYETWLLNGGYEEISYFGNSSHLRIRSCLVDADGDGRKEMLIEMADTSSANATGYATDYAYLDIKNDRPVILKTASFSGGTAGGSRLSFLLDKESNEYVLALKDNSRDGTFAYSGSTEIYYILDSSVRYTIGYSYMSMDENSATYKSEVEELKDSIIYYYYSDNGYFTYYSIGDTIVPEDDYEHIENLYIEPTNSAYQLKNASYNNPIA